MNLDDEKMKNAVETADDDEELSLKTTVERRRVANEWERLHLEREERRTEIKDRHRNEHNYDSVIERPARPTPTIDDGGEKRVAVYARVSTMSLDQTSSIVNQEKYYAEKVRSNPNWILQKVYSDEGKSGTSMKHREAFRQMLKDARDGKIDLIVCASVSRFARNVTDCIEQVTNLKTMNPRHPVGVYFETENLYTLNEANYQALDFHAMLADWESRNKSSRMLLSYDQRIMMQQYPVSDMLGLRHTKDGDLVIQPEEAKTVRFIYLSYIIGRNVTEIAEILTEKKRPTLKGRTEWNDAMVRNVMQNERRWGDLEARKYVVIDYKKGRVARNLPDENGGYIRNGAYVTHHHEGIVSKDIAMAAKYLSVSPAGVRKIPEMYVIDRGALKGFVSINPAWSAVDDKLFQVACRSVYTNEETDELDYESRIRSGEEHSKMYSMYLTGYQVPHGGYFIKNTLPAMTLSENGILFNAMCHKRLDGCRFVEVLYHPILQTIILRPSNEDNPNSFEWENNNGKPKQVISTRAFCRAIYDQMEWMNEYRFKFRGIERSRGNTKVLIFALDEPQILVNKFPTDPHEGTVEYINYKRDSTIPEHGKNEQLKGRAFVAYPAELTHGNVGLTYSMKRRLDTISHNLTEEDITSDGVTFVNPMMQKLPTRQEMLDEVDRLLESM